MVHSPPLSLPPLAHYTWAWTPHILGGAFIVLLVFVLFRYLALSRRLSQKVEAFEAVERRLRLVLDHAPCILWATDADLRFTFSDGAGLADLGLVPGQVVGTDVRDYFGSRDPAFLPVTVHLQALEGKPGDYEMDWAGRTYQVHVEPLRDAAGHVIGTAGAAVDITRRKQTELALGEAEAGRRALLAAIPDVLFRVRGDGTVLEFVDQLTAPVPDPAGRHLRDLYPRETADRLLGLAESALKTGRVQVSEHVIPSPRGHGDRHFEARLVATGADEVLVILRNVTERQRIVEDLRRREAELRALVRSLPDLVFQLDAHGRIVGCVQPRAHELYLPPEQFLGRRMADVLPPEVGRLFTDHLEQVHVGRPAEPFVYALPIRGELRRYEARMVPLADSAGGVLALVRHLTERPDPGAPANGAGAGREHSDGGAGGAEGAGGASPANHFVHNDGANAVSKGAPRPATS